MKNHTITTNRRLRHFTLVQWRRHLSEAKGLLKRTAWWIGLLSLVFGIAGLDYTAGKSIHIFTLFLIPTILAVWKLGLPAGLFFSVICALSGLTVDLLTQPNKAAVFAYINTAVRLFVFLLIVYGSWKILRMGDRLAELSMIDSLTGMNNRRSFMLRGKEELYRMKRDNHPISIIFIDLDNFKSINDTMGHNAGDEVLQMSAAMITHCLRQVDFPARLGGDEFAAILPSTNGTGAQVLAEKIQHMLRESFSAKKLPISASIGIATFMKAPISFEHALKCADNIMYEVKNSSKNAILQRDYDDSIELS